MRQLEFPWTLAAAPEAILDAVAARQRTETLAKAAQDVRSHGRAPWPWQRDTDAAIG